MLAPLGDTDSVKHCTLICLGKVKHITGGGSSLRESWVLPEQGMETFGKECKCWMQPRRSARHCSIASSTATDWKKEMLRCKQALGAGLPRSHGSHRHRQRRDTRTTPRQLQPSWGFSALSRPRGKILSKTTPET